MNKFNKLLVASLIGASAIAISAQADQMQKDLRQNAPQKLINASGAYILAGGGVSDIRHNVNDKHIQSGQQNVNFVAKKTSSYLHAGVGYGFQIKQNYYAALEADYDYAFDNKTEGSQTDNLGAETYYTITGQSQLELNAIFGRTFCHNYLGYVKAGYAATWLINSIGYGPNAGNPSDPNNPGTFGSKYNFRPGLILGAGVRMPVSRKFELSAEYDYINYFKDTYSKITTSASTVALTPINFNIADKMHSNNLVVSLLYKI